MRFAPLVLLTLLAPAGCSMFSGGSAGAGSQDQKVPRLPVGATASRFQHFCAWGPFGSLDALERMLDDAGEQGWELVTFAERTMCFKRRIGEVTGAAPTPPPAAPPPAAKPAPAASSPAPAALAPPARLPSPPDD